MSAHAVGKGAGWRDAPVGACTTTAHAYSRMQTHVRALTQSLMLPSCSMSSFAPDLHLYLKDLGGFIYTYIILYAYKNIHIYMYIHTYIHTYTHTHTHEYIYMYYKHEGAPCTICVYCIHARGKARAADARVLALTLRSPARRRRWQRHRRRRGARTAFQGCCLRSSCQLLDR